MPRWPLRAASVLLLTLGAALEVSAAPQAEDLQRLKRLQQWQLITEPAERVEKRKEQLKRFQEWRKVQKRKGGTAGNRIKLPPAKVTDLVRGARPDFFAGARPAARAAVAAVSNFLANDTTGEPSGSCQSEVSIAAIGNDVLAAWNDGIGVYTGSPHFQGYAWSTDGGVTWTDGGAPPSAGIGFWSSDPVVTANADGEFYFSALADQSTTSGVAVVRGTFGGFPRTFTWGTPRMAVTLNTSSFCPDKNWVVADSVTGNVYVTYTQFIGPCSGPNSDEIALVRSTDSGQTWSSPIVLSSAGDAGFVQGSRPAVGPDGEVYVVWHAIGQPANSPEGHDFLRIRKSVNGGVSFGAEATAASIFSNFGSGGPGFNRGRGITFPGIAVDASTGPHRGRVHLCWSEAVNFYADNFPQPGTAPALNEREPNDDSPGATSFSPGTILRGLVIQPDDLDYWKWDAVQGQTYSFWLDSLYSNLDASFRVFTTNGTNLAFSQNGYGGQDFIVFTAPSTETFYLRVGSYTGSQTGRYRIRTVSHTPNSFDLARDHRDVFVRYSDNGTTWGPVVRVNDEPGYYDDYLPEVATDVDGRVFTAVYDWRDSRPEDGGGASSVYLYRSDDGGASWIGGTRIQTEENNWTATFSTLIPNQGDYIGLSTSGSTVFMGWSEGRRPVDPDPDVYVAATDLNCATAPVASVSAQAGPDSARIVWSAPTGTVGQVYRRASTGDWVNLGPVVATASQVVYIDYSVVQGQTYSYRLGVTGFCQDFVGYAFVSVPGAVGPALAIHGTRPNPTPGDVVVSFTLPATGAATLALYDITGRQVVSMDVSALGAGPHVVNLTQGMALQSGMYFLRLTQGGRKTQKRVAVFP